MSDATETTTTTAPVAAPAAPKIALKSFFMKDGEFSKTAAFASVANALVLMAYVMSWFAGSKLAFGDVATITFPAFDDGAAMALLTILNGTYLSNNFIKTKSAA